jgi:pimeloyl-ACP methyl ester carboxylesterase
MRFRNSTLPEVEHDLHALRQGRGEPLLLVHGLGGNAMSWSPVLPALAARHEVIAVDLPGSGDSPPLSLKNDFHSVADALAMFLKHNGLVGIDAVGSSMGARLVLELARRGMLGAVVALDPGGFACGWQRRAFHLSLSASVRLLRVLRRAVPWISRNALARAVCLAQISAHPTRLSAALVRQELQSYIASPNFDALLKDLAEGPLQAGAPAGSIRQPLVIGWGRHDRITLPSQAGLAATLFPDARLHWFEDSGHFPHWDQPEDTVRLIEETLARDRRPAIDIPLPAISHYLPDTNASPQAPAVR